MTRINVITWLKADDTELTISLEGYAKLIDMLNEIQAEYKIEDRVKWEIENIDELTKIHYKTLFIDRDTALFTLKKLL